MTEKLLDRIPDDDPRWRDLRWLAIARIRRQITEHEYCQRLDWLLKRKP